MVAESSDFNLHTQKDFSEQRMNNEPLQSGSTQPTTRFHFLLSLYMIELKC